MTKITYIPGEIANAAIDEHGKRKPVTRTQHIFDDSKGKSQAEINTDIDDKFTQVDNEVEALEKQDVIPVDTLPAVATADPKKIYRVVGENSYTDHMVNATGDGWKTLATYSFPGIDDKPTAGSDKLVKSGGVAGELYKTNKKVDNQPSICPSYNDADLDLGDENGNVLARFKDGHIKTKNFDSKDMGLSFNHTSNGDFEVSDENNNVLLLLKDGNIRTKNFDSESLKVKTSNNSDLEVADEDGNVLLYMQGGGIRTKNFSSENHYVHFSFDDGRICLTKLFAGNYTSVWDCPFFKLLKILHDTYGATFTVNLFIDVFSTITNKYASELGSAADWLKWTLHGDENTNYGESGGTYPGGRTSGGEDWDDMVAAVVTLTGTPVAIDRHTRLSNFAGTEANITAMRDRKFGAICFSAADDNRLSYNFDSNEKAYTWNKEYYFESKTRLFFVRTFTRFDSFTFNAAGLSSINNYIKSRGFSEFFIHEPSILDSNGELKNTGVEKLISFFSIVRNNKYNCSFFNFNIL